MAVLLKDQRISSAVLPGTGDRTRAFTGTVSLSVPLRPPEGQGTRRDRCPRMSPRPLLSPADSRPAHAGPCAYA